MELDIESARQAVGKVLGLVSGGVLEAWAESKEIGTYFWALRMELLNSQWVLNNTRSHGRKIQIPALAELLQELWDVVNRANNMLDELDYFRIQDELDNMYQEDKNGCTGRLVSSAFNTIHAVGKHLPCYCVSPLPNDFNSNIVSSGNRFICCSYPNKALQTERLRLSFHRVKMSKRLKEIVEQLKHVCAKVATILNEELLDYNRSVAQCNAMSLNAGSTNLHWQTTKHTFISEKTTKHTDITEHTEPRLFGRTDEVEMIIHNITEGRYYKNNLTVLAIVGPGGIGKTTLTQHIYQELGYHFDVRLWACVSINFNADRLTREIASQLGNGKNNIAHIIVEETLKSKRFLLVLDDMWDCRDQDEWEGFLVPFKKGQCKGSVILVTTRISKLAQMVTTDCLYLKDLASEAFTQLFFSYAFDDRQSMKDHDELLQIGYKIVEKLKGSPLAAKTVGRLLRNNHTAEHWIRILESKEWELSNSDYDIMTALKLSFDSLPFVLQQCFTYCALFPGDYRFSKEEIIHFWIGQDVLYSHDENKTIEEIGQSHLIKLVDFGFFRREEDKYGSISYTIHDLLHELAQKVSAGECLSISNLFNLRSILIPPSIHHLSINIDASTVQDRKTFDACKENFSAMESRLKIENLQSLMLFGSHLGSFVKTFGGLFSKAKALRAILISGENYCVEDLLCNLSNPANLRYLRIQGGTFRSQLIDIARFYNLRVLDLEGSYHLCYDSPRSMSSLLKLRHFLVPNDQMHSSIFEVGKLKSLQEFRRFSVHKERRGFDLRQMGNLLELRGSLCIDNLEKVEVGEEAYEAKLMHKKYLRKLMLVWDINQSCKDPSRGEQVLEGLTPASNLVELCIRGHGGATCPSWLGVNLSVENLECLRLDGVAWEIFPPIGELFLVNVHGEEVLSNITAQNFQNLRLIELVRIPQLKKWAVSCTFQLFSHMEVLIIKYCPELIELPFLQSLNGPPKLRELMIQECPKLLSLPPIPWSRVLCSVGIKNAGLGFEQLVYEKDYEGASSLRIVGKEHLDNSFWMALNFDNLTKLKNLEIMRCASLRFDHLQMLPSLITLSVSDSNNSILSFQDGIHVPYQFPVECFDIRRIDSSGKELTQVLSYMPKVTKLMVSLCLKVTGLGVMEQHRNEASGGMEAQIVEKDNFRKEEEIAALPIEGLLLLPTLLQELWIEGCPELRLLPDSHVGDEEARLTGRTGGLQDLCFLHSLEIWNCPKFLSGFSSTSSCFPFPTSLKKLCLIWVEGMETLALLSNLVSLNELNIERCGDLRGDLSHLHSQCCLTELYVSKTPNFFIGSKPSQLHDQEFPSYSSHLQELRTDDTAGVLTVPICSFFSSSLTTLVLSENQETERFTEKQEEALNLLTSLQVLKFCHCDKLQYLPAGLYRLINLKRIQIENCPAIQIRTNNRFPDCLQELKIWCCPAIRILPNDGLPCSLRVLDVRGSDSEELKRQCRKLIGVIPIVQA